MEKLRLTGHVGSSDSQRHEFVIVNSQEIINKSYTANMKKASSWKMSADDRQEIVGRLLSEAVA
jgi:hypothetical protein